MAAQYWGKQDAASIEKVIPIALRTNLLFSGLFTILAGFCPEMLMRIFTNDAALVASGSQYLRAVALSYRCISCSADPKCRSTAKTVDEDGI